MFLRITLPVKKNSYTTLKPYSNIERWEGGCWFCETLDEVRRTYVVQDKKYSNGILIEILKEMPENYSKLPCWKDSLQRVSLLQVSQEPQQVSQEPLLSSGCRLELFEWFPQHFQQEMLHPPQLVQQQPQQQQPLQQLQQSSLPLQQLVLSLPTSSQLPEWAIQLLEPLHKEFQILSKTNKTFSQLLNPICHVLQKQQHQVLQEEFPLQIDQSSLSSLKNISSHHQSYSLSSHLKPSQEQVQQSLSQVGSFPSRQGLEIGSLCSPISLQDTLSPKMSLDHPPKHQKHPSQVPLKSRRKLKFVPS